MQKITTLLMFEGQAEEAMKFCASLFKQSKKYALRDMEEMKLAQKEQCCMLRSH